eukprot:11836598-Alexandrium_andersonii.AAC.1
MARSRSTSTTGQHEPMSPWPCLPQVLPRGWGMGTGNCFCCGSLCTESWPLHGLAARNQFQK